MAQSDLEAAFDYYWRVLDGPPVEINYHFDLPHSKRELDRAHPRTFVAVEIQGGTWVSGAHSRGKRYSEDCIKANDAILQGWKLFRLTSDMIQNDPQKHIGQIIEFIQNQIDNGNTWVKL